MDRLKTRLRKRPMDTVTIPPPRASFRRCALSARVCGLPLVCAVNEQTPTALLEAADWLLTFWPDDGFADRRAYSALHELYEGLLDDAIVLALDDETAIKDRELRRAASRACESKRAYLQKTDEHRRKRALEEAWPDVLAGEMTVGDLFKRAPDARSDEAARKRLLALFDRVLAQGGAGEALTRARENAQRAKAAPAALRARATEAEQLVEQLTRKLEEEKRQHEEGASKLEEQSKSCLLYTSPSPRDS